LVGVGRESVRRLPYSDGLPVVALLRRERCPPGAEDLREAGVVDLEGLAPEVELVDAVVVVEPDDRVIRAGFAVVVSVLDPFLESLRRRDREQRTRATVPSA